MDEVTHKTVFLLDHTKLMTEYSGLTIDIDTGSRQQSNAASMYFPLIPSLMKSLWTCTAESTLEYARIITDVDTNRLIRFMTSNPHSAISLNSWNVRQQTMSFMFEAFAAAGPPLNAPGSIQTGITAAIQALAEPTPLQQEQHLSNTMRMKSSRSERRNRGRIICITSCIVDFDIQDFVLSQLTKHNMNSSELLPIDLLEFTLISLHGIGKDHLCRVLSRSRHEVSPIFFSETYVVTADNINQKLVDICVNHHNLVSKVISHIPMKEEAQSSSSINYDVPLFHPRTSATNEDSQILRWQGPNPPKGVSGTLFLCNQAKRVSPVEVISRPTTCLSNFVLNGRSVWLETPKKTATGKTVTSNVLLSHGGEIWLHCMDVNRNLLEDPPSISEGPGGRCTDYRIPDFVELIKQCLLAPYGSDSGSSSSSAKFSNIMDSQILPYQKAKERLERKTIFWPITINSSVLFSLPAHLDNLLRIFPKDTLNEMEKVECEKSFWSLMAIEARGENPPLLSSFHLKKGLKKDEQWRLVYGEIETFLRANLHSPAHKDVLDCFMESRKTDDVDVIDSVTNGTNGAKDGTSSENGGKKRNGSFTKQVPPPVKKQKLENNEGSSDSNHSTHNNNGPRMNLLGFWRLKTEKPDSRALPAVIKLYSHLTAPTTATPDEDKDERVSK